MITELRTPFSCQALDFVISEARKHKIRLILPLCNNWKDYGGCKVEKGGWAESTSDDDFFTDPTIKSYYKAFVKVNFLLGWLKIKKWASLYMIIFISSEFEFLIKANFHSNYMYFLVFCFLAFCHVLMFYHDRCIFVFTS